MRFARLRNQAFAHLLIGSVSVACLSSIPLHAHEIGSTRVSVVFTEAGNYDIEIVTDAAALVEKLQAISGPASSELRAGRGYDSLTSLENIFRRRVTVAFDGQEVRPAISFLVVPPTDSVSSAIANIRLTGTIPVSAGQFTWKYAWTFSSYSLSIRPSPGEPQVTEWLEGGQTSSPLALSATFRGVSRLGTAWQYLKLGFTHIVPLGLDHVLFVLGIYLLTARARSVLWQVSAFTVAHSITLGLSMFDVLSVSSAIVEPLIALSIAYVAVENILVSELKSWRVALVFAFGLLHGLGFAGALKELGLPRTEFVTALLTFNLGVEAGQLAVIGAAFLLVGWHWAHRIWYRSRIVVPVSGLIACTAVYWTISRLT